MRTQRPKKTVSYIFAHVAVPIVALGDPGRLRRELSKKSGTKYLVKFWKGIEGKTGSKGNAAGLAVSKAASATDFDIFIITMPPPSAAAEAIFVGILFFLENRSVRNTLPRSRYFTLELYQDPATSQHSQMLCEWTGVISRRHLNYGHLADASEFAFRNAILSMVNGRGPEPAAAITGGGNGQQMLAQLLHASLEQAALGNLDYAIAGFSKIVEIDPTNAAAFYHLGKVKLNQGDLHGAVADISRALQLDPENSDAYNDRGIARKKLGDLQGAIADYSQVLRIDPGFHRAFVNRGIVRYELGDQVGACRDFKRAARHGVPGARSGLIQAGCDRIEY